jgi:hypothetical protein
LTLRVPDWYTKGVEFRFSMSGHHVIDDDSFAVVRNDLTGTIRVVSGGGELWVNPLRETLLLKSSRLISGNFFGEQSNPLGAQAVHLGDGTVFADIQGTMVVEVIPSSEELVATRYAEAWTLLRSTIADAIVRQPCCADSDSSPRVLTLNEIATCQSQALASAQAIAQQFGFTLLAVELSAVSLWTSEAFEQAQLATTT